MPYEVKVIIITIVCVVLAFVAATWLEATATAHILNKVYLGC